MKLIIGLGNPGKEYEKTRHNAGFMVLDVMVEKNDSAWKKDTAHKSMIAKLDLDDEKVLLAKPQTFMNLSGQAISLLKQYYKIDSQDILVVQDDLDLPAGTFAFNQSTSAAGHHGIESIQEHLGKIKISRLRIGVGKPRDKKLEARSLKLETKDWVLDKPKGEDAKLINQAIVDAADASLDWASFGLEQAMNKWNNRKKLEVIS
jgi:PTH1 family peptidyl-tRNA hydrolase